MRTPTKASLFACLGGAAIAVLAWCGTRKAPSNPSETVPATSGSVTLADPKEAGVETASDDGPEPTDPTFRRPTGETPVLTCDEARSITAQVGDVVAFTFLNKNHVRGPLDAQVFNR